MAKKPVNIIGLKRQRNILMERHAEFVELAKTSTMEQLMAHFERSRSTIARHLNMYNIPHVTSRSNAPPARMYFVENRWIIRINKVKPSGEGCRGDNWGGSFLTKEDAEAAIQEVVRLGPTEYIARYRATLEAKREATRQKNTPTLELTPKEIARIQQVAAALEASRVEKAHISWVNSKDFQALSYAHCYV